jgi:hypothetical protein
MLPAIFYAQISIIAASKFCYMNHPIVTGVLAYGMSGKVFHTPFVDTHQGFNLYAVTERNIKTAHERFPGIKSLFREAEYLTIWVPIYWIKS